MILHIDMDAFFASIEQAVNPRLKGKPLIVGSRNNQLHTVVCAASYEAKSLGIHSGMNSAEAFKICPHLEFVPASQGRYIWTSGQILEMLQGYGLPLNYASIDEFQLDITSCSFVPLKLAREIQEKIYAGFKLTASIGIAKNWLLSKLASKVNKPNGIVFINEDNLQEILSRTALTELCGMGGKTGQIFSAQGIKTCWDLYRKMPDFFRENPGKFEEMQIQKPKSIGHAYTLPMPIANPAFICAWIRLLSEMVGERLRSQNLAARTIHLWLSSPEIGSFGQQKTFPQATNDSFEVYLRAVKILRKIRQKQPVIRALGVTASQLEAISDSLALFSQQQRREALIKAQDQINQRFGEGAIYPAQVMLIRKNSSTINGNKW